jgi:hypothetical protein
MHLRIAAKVLVLYRYQRSLTLQVPTFYQYARGLLLDKPHLECSLQELETTLYVYVALIAHNSDIENACYSAIAN